MTKQELVEHIFDVYSVEPDHPFARDPVIAVFRHVNTQKWFAVTMNVPYRTLGIARDGSVDILNVKGDPLVIGSLRGKTGFCPAYHMSKEQWITILLDGSADRDAIIPLLDMSYELTKHKPRRK